MKVDPAKLEYEMGKNLMNLDLLSKASGINRVTLSNLKNGKAKNPRPETVKAIAEALHCEPADLIVKP